MPEQEERILTLLQERGINGGASLLAELDAQGVAEDTILVTIKWWDDLPMESKGTGLLVSRLKQGGISGYRRPHERTGVDGEIVFGPKQASWLRRLALTPDGIDRETVSEMCAKLAAKAQTTPDALIDTAVDPAWQETPPHPARLDSIGDSVELRSVRYEAWMHMTHNESRPEHPDPSVTRREGETDFDFSCRFWGWEDPPELAERARKLKAARERRREEAKAQPGGTVQKAVEQSLDERQLEDTSTPSSEGQPAMEEPTPAPESPELDEKFGKDAPWEDADLEGEDPW